MRRSRPRDPVAEPGDVWVLGRHRLLCGDSTVATDVAARARRRRAAPDGHRPALRRRLRPGLAQRDGRRATARIKHREGSARSPTTTGPTGARPGRCSPARSPMSGTPAATPAPCRTRLSRCRLRDPLRRSSGPRTASRSSRGHYHWQHEPCWYAVRKGTAGLGPATASRSTLWQIPAREGHRRPATARRSRSSA